MGVYFVHLTDITSPPLHNSLPLRIVSVKVLVLYLNDGSEDGEIFFQE